MTLPASSTSMPPVCTVFPQRRPTSPVLCVGGTRCDVRDQAAAVDEIVSRAQLRDHRKPLAVASSNLDHVYHFGVCGSDIVERSSDVLDWLVLIDGAPIAMWARLKAQVPAPVLTGSDLLPLLLEKCEREGVRVGFFGGSKASQAALGARLSVLWPSLQVSGMWSPSRELVMDLQQSASLAGTIAGARTELLVVGLGKPRQENWIALHGQATGAGALLAFGASADFVAGIVPRAPRAVSRVGLEWAFRLALEPRRLYRRYLVQGPRSAMRLLTSSSVLDTGRERRRVQETAGADAAYLVPAPRMARRAEDLLPPTAAATLVAAPAATTVTALVVTYNSAAHVGKLLASLLDSPVDHVVVVDNGSTDETVSLLRRRSPEWARAGLLLTVVDSGRNAGYAAGINLARQHMRGPGWSLILNPDVEVSSGTVEALLASARRSGAGALVPAMSDDTGVPYPSLRREPSVLRALGDALFGARFRSRPAWSSETVWNAKAYTEEGPADWATGAALLVSPDCAARVGEWDERFFLYSEETDYLRRVRACGFEVRHVPAARVVHVGSGSGASDRLTTLMTVNRVRYYQKHHGRVASRLFGAAVSLHCMMRPWQPASRAALAELGGAARAGLADGPGR